jgi:hypothetical protein
MKPRLIGGVLGPLALACCAACSAAQDLPSRTQSAGPYVTLGGGTVSEGSEAGGVGSSSGGGM